MGQPTVNCGEPAEDQAEVSRSRRMVRCICKKFLVVLAGIVIIAVVMGVSAAIVIAVNAGKNTEEHHIYQNNSRVVMYQNTSIVIGDNKRVFHSLNLNMQCSANGSVILEFSSEEVRKLTMYSYIFDSGLKKICGERRVSERRQLLVKECQNSSSTGFLVNIFEHGDEAGKNIALHDDDVHQCYDYTFICDHTGSQEMHTELIFTDRLAYFSPIFTIGDTNFNSVITFSEKRKNTGRLGEPVKIEIEIKNENLFGEKSHFENCKLDIFHVEGHVESIFILTNSSLTSEGSLMEFRFEYTGSEGPKPAKYTVEFKAFVLRNLKPFYFNCQASSN